MEITVLPIVQDGTRMYVGAMKVDDILKYGKVDVWRMEGDVETGYQREPETGRARKVARYLRSSARPLMPLSVFLGLRCDPKIKPGDDGTVKMTIPDGEVLWEIDGQHRLAGFQRVIEEDGVERFRDYVLPVVIIAGSSMETEAEQFRIINENMKKVRTDLARRILALMGRTVAGRRELAELGRDWEAKSVEVLKELATRPESPWYDKIQFPNVRKQPSHAIREASFQTSLKPLLTERPFRDWRPQRVADVLADYWEAWRELIPDAFEHHEDYVLLKTPGVFSLHELAVYVFESCRVKGITNPGKEDFKEVLVKLGEYAEQEYWTRDNYSGAAAAGSMKGFRILYTMMREQLIDEGYTID